MRLLKFDDRGALSLTEDLHDNIPPYAILSHTWGDDRDEVTFDDLKENSFQSKAGYAKIRFCGEQAKKDGLEYFWVDACCINKANNIHEYSEAINSMFRWYRDAVKCYVYLVDVSIFDGDEDHAKRTWKLAFRKSRWFTRGWTLQELLAPESVEFFSREGERLGDKETLGQTIHEVTTIPITALRRDIPLSEFSVDERMRWAAMRVTKKKEDQAYCLLGIFDVFLPLIYGEGENAIARLREAIDKRKKQERGYYSDEHCQCHRALKTSTYERFKDVNPDRVEGTCGWVLSHPQYRQWHEKPYDDLLWISADPGCGKSVLAKSLVDHELQNTNQHTVCHFFFKDNDEQDDVVTALCALLHQLFSQQPWLINHALSAWEKSGDKVAKEEAELWRILLSAARADEAHDVTCLLDALDECRPSDRRWLIDMLSRFHTQTLDSPSSSRRGRLKFLVTSRPYDDIRTNFQNTIHDLPTIRLRGEEENEQIHREIDLVIRMRVERLARDLRFDSNLKDRLKTTLLKMEHRTYLWLHLAVTDIYETFRNSMRPEQESIELLPPSVEDAYEKILARVSLKQKDKVKKILQVVVGARRPLTIGEMAIALGIATTAEPKSLHGAQLNLTRLQSNIRGWCGLFIFLNHNRIYLIHQTAKEFLVSNSDSNAASSGWRYCLRPQQIEKEMARICIQYLCMEEVGATAESLIQKFQKRERIDNHLEKGNHLQSLLVYSAEYWPSHLRESSLPRDDSTVFRALELYQVNGKLYRRWFPIFWKATRQHEDLPQMSPILLGGLLGHEIILELLLQRDNGISIDKWDAVGRKALLLASGGGYGKAVQILLNHDAHINGRGVRSYFRALERASSGGHEKVVQILFDHGVNLTSGIYGRMLQNASYCGYEKWVELLLAKGVNVHAEGGRPGKALRTAEHIRALQEASSRGHAKVVKMLLAYGANINAEGGSYGSALEGASSGGHKEVVQILLDHGADINAQWGRYGSTALRAASSGGHKEVVQILLDHGADINAQGGRYGSTALRAASSGGHKEVVQILLDRGADVNTQRRKIW